MGKRPRSFYGITSSPIENCGCAMCTWSVGRGSPGGGRSKSPSLVVCVHVAAIDPLTAVYC